MAVPGSRIGGGSPEPLGVTLGDGGINVAVFSANAVAIDFCLFDAEGGVEIERIALPERTGDVFHGFIRDLGVGARYGLRAHGPFAPHEGHRFNANKLLVDPYAGVLDRPFKLDPSMFGYRLDDPRDGASFDETDSAPAMPKAIVGPPLPAAASGARVPWADTVIYEAHVRGFTRLHPDIPHAVRGTFAALAHPAAIDHLVGLGVTTLELLPTSAWIDERHLGLLGLTNYWGYNPVSYLAPDPRLAPGGWGEIAGATAALARAGIEVILDVVFNHTGEGDALGPTLSLRGLDNAAYYRLNPNDPARYIDDAGTGNILALDRPAAIRLTMDSLRAWVRQGGVSGFRFDLATVLGRRADGFDPGAPLLAAIEQDPELRAVKLIAEPWDCGPGGYQLGRFPGGWGEWNDRYRDTARRFWRGEDLSIGHLARRVSGSQDLLAAHRRPSRSVNFITAHDGFTLADLVSYADKHNEANGEANRDGSADNQSWNNGVEGPTTDADILSARRRDQRALLATVMLSRGTPMIAMGSELGHGQGGNNNAYAQDNALSWIDWAKADPDLKAFAQRLGRLRRAHPALRADRFLSGSADETAPYPDVDWRRPDGGPLEAHDWDDPRGATLVAVLAAAGKDGTTDRALIVLHRGDDAIEVVLPGARDGFIWIIQAESAGEAATGRRLDGPAVAVSPRSVVLVTEAPAPGRRQDTEPELLNRLAQAAGIAPDWWSVAGQRYPVAPDTQRALLAAMGLPADSAGQARDSLWRLGEADRRALPFSLVLREGQALEVPVRGDFRRPGWLRVEAEDGSAWRLRLETGADRAILPALPPGRYKLMREDSPQAPCRLTVAPHACYLPEALRGGARRWGVSAQLYALRRVGDQGVGDFTALGDLSAAAGVQGAALLAINPLHALFAGQPDRASPYHPSDRRFLNPIYLDVERLAHPQVAARRIEAAPARPLVDYPGVWAAKSAAFEASFAAFEASGGGSQAEAFARFVASCRTALHRFAAFQAISDARSGEPWMRWPPGLRDPAGPEVKAFVEAHQSRLRFHYYLQWLCESQLAAAAGSGALAIGLCRDLAVGSAPDGAEAWAAGALLAHEVSVGSPPDPFSATGQVWGLPPPIPHLWSESGHQAFQDLLVANMRHAGALRIDHVMGLARLFWVPHGAEGKDGAYVAYPLQDLLGHLALESQRARCMVVGEDLGTVPHGLRETLSDARVLSFRVLQFERDGPLYRPPQAYPEASVACVATHDLPTLAGWWSGADIAERRGLGLLDEAAAKIEAVRRQADKARLLEALVEAGLNPSASAQDDLTPELAGDIHGYVALAPTWLTLIQCEDLSGEETAVNLPGTDRERPNWRRRLEKDIAELFSTPASKNILCKVKKNRCDALTDCRD